MTENPTYRKALDDVLDRERYLKKEWLDKTKDIYNIYSGEKADATPFNILYSNTEILVPNVFSSAPKPIVRRRFGNMSADHAAQAAERMAEYSMDTNLSEYPAFVDAIEAVVMDAALPGQGQARVRVVNNIVLTDYIQHDAFIWGYAKRWEDVPWVAYRHDKTLEDIFREFSVPEEQQALVTKPNEHSEGSGAKGPATVALYEVWNKSDRMVRFYCEAFPDCFVTEMEDPLRLSGFFPSGKPLRLLETPNSTLPRPMYNLYRKQADELNLVTQRIRKVASAIQVRGIYDGSLPELAQILESGNAENALFPANSPGALSREGGLDKHIWLMPIEKLVTVLQTLYQVREQIKSTIYEILGIGDILRGVSAASETASAQKIKDKWGSLRIKKSREKVSRFVRWHIRAMIELSAEHIPEEIWAKVTGLPFMPSQQAAQMPPPQQGEERPPVWGEVLSLLQNDLTRSYTIDIESNSTVDADATQDKEEVAEFMNALGQAMSGLDGLAQQGPEGMEAAKTLLIELCKRFRMGTELVSKLSAVKSQPKGPTPEQEKLQQELDQKAQDLQSQEDGIKQSGEQMQQQFQQQKEQLQVMAQTLAKQQLASEKQLSGIKIAMEQLSLLGERIKLEERGLAVSKQAAEVALQSKAVALQSKAATTQFRALS